MNEDIRRKKIDNRQKNILKSRELRGLLHWGKVQKDGFMFALQLQWCPGEGKGLGLAFWKTTLFIGIMYR